MPRHPKQAITNRFLSFFEVECRKYEKVLYVLGNHEYYNGIFQHVLKQIRDRMPDNVTVLNNDVYDAGEVLFVGGTLWTDMNKSDPLTMFHITRIMNDFKCIRINDTNDRFTPEHSVIEHEKTLAYFKLMVEQNRNREIFVISHHSPSWQSCHPKYANDKIMNGGFHTELSEFILDNPHIKHWVHGHTHDEFDYNIGDCRVVCNPRGYWPYEADANYQPKTIITL